MAQDDLTTIINRIIIDLVHDNESQKGLAMKMGIDRGSMSRKLSGQQGWMPTEFAAILKEGGYSLISMDELAALRVFAKKGINQ
jgi:hypothetical protein